MRRRLAVLAGAAAIAATGVFVSAGPASAKETDYRQNGANIRASASINSAIVGKGYIGQGASTECAKFGPGAGGNEDYWIRHVNKATGVRGFTVGANIAGVINDLPTC